MVSQETVLNIGWISVHHCERKFRVDLPKVDYNSVSESMVTL